MGDSQGHPFRGNQYSGGGVSVSRGDYAASRPIPVKAYNAIFKVTKAGPFDGGCVLFAQALQESLGGGEIVALTAGGVAQHAVVKRQGVFYDADGAASSLEAIQRRFAKHEMTRIDGARALRDSDLPDSPRDASAAKVIAPLLKKWLSR